jgi:uncharacterized lipoprotein YmbA
MFGLFRKRMAKADGNMTWRFQRQDVEKRGDVRVSVMWILRHEEGKTTKEMCDQYG